MGENNTQSRVAAVYRPGDSGDPSPILVFQKPSRPEPTGAGRASPEPLNSLTSSTSDQKAARMLELFANEHFNRVRTVRRMRLQLLSWVIRNKIKNSLKRVLDLVLVIPLLILLSPVYLVVALAVKLDSPGPAIFRQERVGKWGKPFICYKFRSMRLDAEQRKEELLALNDADEVIFKIKDDPRVTRVGYLIRKTSLDELPQLVNVLKGEMSLVGPRPPVPYEVQRYQYDHLRRLDVVPGITGLQQVSGRSDLPFKQWVEYDIQYIEESSLLKDIQIMLRTIPTVIFRKGAY